MCWITGLFGWALAVLLARPISQWVFDDSEHVLAISILGATLLLGAIKSGQAALVQGVRRIGDLARINVYGMLINTAVAIGAYAWLREDGILPVLLATAAVSLGVSWWFARRIEVQQVTLDWRQTFRGARRLVGLGSAFMWSGLLTAGLDMATRSLITKEYGIDAAGLYQAAWALSGMFAGFILSAMGADFYPRLTSVIDNHEKAIRTVNEQTEIGLLLALPGLLVTLAFAPLVIELFYSKAFLPAAELLPWFLLGIFGRVVSWPLGYIQLAKGVARWFAVTQTVHVSIQLVLMVWLVMAFGVIGAAYGFSIAYFLYTLGMLWVGRVLIGFRWSRSVARLLVLSATLVVMGALAVMMVGGWSGTGLAAAVAVFGGVASMRGLSVRLSETHPLVRGICRLPGSRWLLYSGTRV
jgi:PST family polysaccharide transporter